MYINQYKFPIDLITTTYDYNNQARWEVFGDTVVLVMRCSKKRVVKQKQGGSIPIGYSETQSIFSY